MNKEDLLSSEFFKQFMRGEEFNTYMQELQNQ